MSHYDDLITKLQAAHFYPAKKLVTVGKNSKVVEGLLIDGPPILKQERGDRIREVSGSDYSVDWIPNQNHFIIKKK